MARSARDQAAVVVAHVETQAALAEIVLRRIGAFEVGQLKNAFVDGGEREIELSPRRW